MINRIKTENREEWKALRKNYIGGSDAAAIVGMNSFSSPFAVWAEKTGQVPEFEGNLATEVGTFLEEFVAKKFEEETGKTVRRCNLSLVNDELPWAIANVDRLVVGEDAGLEIKTTSALNTKSFRNGEYPANYYVQCVHYLAVTGKVKWYLAVLIGNSDFRIFEINRDEEEIKALMDEEKKFWETYVKTGMAPPVDGNSATTETIKKLFTSEADGTADLGPFMDALQRRSSINKQIKALKADVDEIDNAIKMAMQNVSSGSCLGFSVSWKTQKTSSLDRDLIKMDYPGFDFSKYATSARVFRVTEKKQKSN